MYLMKTKKQIEQNDLQDLLQKEEKNADRQHRETAKSPTKGSDENSDDFKPDDLPDGACFRPKGVVDGADDGETAVRPAEYIGSFSVSGTDQNSRAEFVQSQLETMRDVSKSKKVLLVMSLSGVKVCSSSGESVYMAHALKRISYAASDPDHKQFAFLAREPKGHINIQFCHAFITKTPEAAEELNTLIGNAFKMAYAQQKVRQPTFNEVIEQQLVEQKAKFAEYQEQANRTLQARLNEIATPTALQRMEVRRQSSNEDTMERDSTPGKNKVWAKQAVDRVQHRSPIREQSKTPRRSDSPTFSSRPSSSGLSSNRKSDPSFSPAKRNSTPPQNSSGNALLSPKRNSSPQLSSMQNFNVVTIRESLENKSTNNSHRFKGSPVTALKDEIDRRYFSNGGLGTIDSGLGFSEDGDSFPRPNTTYQQEPKNQVASKMLHRPLPAIPAPSPSENITDHRASPRLRNWTSLDDDVIPHHTRQTRQTRDSPKRRPQRPQSEIFTESKLSSHLYGIDQPGMYIYGAKSQTQTNIQANTTTSPTNQNTRSPQDLAVNSQSPKYSQTGYDNMQNVRNGKTSPQPLVKSPGASQELSTRADSPKESGPNKPKPPGLESLMGLDRSHIEDETLRHSSWYQAGIPRDVALEILQQEDIGSFIVRDSSTHPGCYALSVRVPKFENQTGISHYLILRTQRGVKLKGLDKEWPTLISLVTHHTVMPEMLPCTLRLPRDTTNPAFKDSDKDDKDEDPDYQRLADFSSMMAALKL